ncbi:MULTISPECIES: ArpU family phage packaging/lysis transcriptional regulator [Lactobacillus]|uniref:ArpU family transcriptional regulator n=1 Tax=Lactobacillus xujianguonis TaxID=2495899 RepID=A0A437STK8_9LACO|nr:MULTISPECIES: ArpU family phage packaging/lysis transcriptional regulator [Lactobacillus]RVU70182.1 ArpU family transcriptional regulator [Lactobacillus xujianguonis]
MADRAEQLFLDDEMAIDHKETARNVRDFLTNNFEKYQNLAGLNPSDLSVIDDSHISSPKMDASGVSAHGGVNHTESSFNRIMAAEQACKAIYHTIRNCRQSDTKPYRKILTEVYLNCVEDTKVQGMLGYSPSQYDELKRRALCEFADRFDAWKYRYHVEYLKDLHAWVG